MWFIGDLFKTVYNFSNNSPIQMILGGLIQNCEDIILSSQVIILSTDEEITREYYNITKPFVSREYLLQNNQGDNCTAVTEGYFFRM